MRYIFKGRGRKGPQLKVRAWRAPTLLVLYKIKDDRPHWQGGNLELRDVPSQQQGLSKDQRRQQPAELLPLRLRSLWGMRCRGRKTGHCSPD